MLFGMQVDRRSLGRTPVTASQFEILLRIDFHVFAGRIRVRHFHPVFDHVLQQMDEIGFLEHSSFPEWFGCVLRASLMIPEAKLRRSSGSKLPDARVFTMGLRRGNCAM